MDENGKRRKKRTRFSGNKQGRKAAEALAGELEGAAERRKYGLVDQALEYAKLPLEEHLEGFEQQLKAGEPSVAYRDRLVRRLRRVLRGIGAGRISDITEERVLRLLLELRNDGLPDRCLSQEELDSERPADRAKRAKPRSPKTRDDYLDTLRQFCRWLVAKGRLPSDPVAGIGHLVSRHRLESTATFVRRAMTPKELGRLIWAAETRAVVNRLKRSPKTSERVVEQLRFHGQTRAMAYLMAATIGVRIGALCELRWHDLDVEAGTVRLRAQYAKNRTEAQPCMPGWLVARVSAWRGRVEAQLGREPAGDERVFQELPLARHVKRLFDRDLEFAGIEPETHEGRLDCHALRTSAATQLFEANVDARTAAKILVCGAAVMDRHYTKFRADGLREAVNRVPEPEYVPKLAGA